VSDEVRIDPMTTIPSTRLLSPEEIAVQAGQQVPFLHLPERATLFAEREMRLRQRAAAHAMRDFLLFMAELARSQHEVLQQHPAVALPDAAGLDAAACAGAAPLPGALLPRLSGSPAVVAVRALLRCDAAWLEQQADRLLTGVMPGLDLAAAPLIAAALQVHWTHLVLATQATRGADRLPPFGRTDDATRCPCCGSLPTAGIARIGAAMSGIRYLHCSLCSAQWHVVRIKCTHCEKTKGIHYQSLRPADEDDTSTEAKQAVEAETCDECRHYLKIVHMERDVHVEPAADDLASLTLDLLVAEAGYQRHGSNLMLLFGDAGSTDGGETSLVGRPGFKPGG
jgi:FdhE protein